MIIKEIGQEKEETIHHTRICTNNLGVQNDMKTRNETRLGRPSCGTYSIHQRL